MQNITAEEDFDPEDVFSAEGNRLATLKVVKRIWTSDFKEVKLLQVISSAQFTLEHKSKMHLN